MLSLSSLFFILFVWLYVVHLCHYHQNLQAGKKRCLDKIVMTVVGIYEPQEQSYSPKSLSIGGMLFVDGKYCIWNTLKIHNVIKKKHTIIKKYSLLNNCIDIRDCIGQVSETTPSFKGSKKIINIIKQKKLTTCLTFIIAPTLLPRFSA